MSRLYLVFAALFGSLVLGVVPAAAGNPVGGVGVSVEVCCEKSPPATVTDKTGTFSFTSQAGGEARIALAPVKPQDGMPDRVLVTIAPEGSAPTESLVTLSGEAWRSAPFRLAAGGKVVVSVNYAAAAQSADYGRGRIIAPSSERATPVDRPVAMQGNPVQGVGVSEASSGAGLAMQGNPLTGVPRDGAPGLAGNPISGVGVSTETNGGLAVQGNPIGGIGTSEPPGLAANPVVGVGVSENSFLAFTGNPVAGVGVGEVLGTQQGMAAQGVPVTGIGVNDCCPIAITPGPTNPAGLFSLGVLKPGSYRVGFGAAERAATPMVAVMVEQDNLPARGLVTPRGRDGRIAFTVAGAARAVAMKVETWAPPPEGMVYYRYVALVSTAQAANARACPGQADSPACLTATAVSTLGADCLAYGGALMVAQRKLWCYAPEMPAQAQRAVPDDARRGPGPDPSLAAACLGRGDALRLTDGRMACGRPEIEIREPRKGRGVAVGRGGGSYGREGKS